MIRFFSEYRILAAILLPVCLVLFIALNLQFPYVSVSSEFNLGLFGTITDVNPVLKTIIGGTIVLINALLINLIFNNQNVYEKTLFLPAFVYIIWMSFFENFYNPDGFLLAHTCFILMVLQLFHLNQNEDGRRNVFNAALFCGIAACLHPVMAVCLPLLFVMVWILRPFVLRESLLLIGGFVTPFLYAIVSMLLQDKWYAGNFEVTQFTFADKSVELLVFGSIVVLFIGFCTIGMRIKMQKSSIRFRKLTRILWFLFFTSLLVGVINAITIQKVEYFSMLFITLSFFSVFTFVKKPLSVFANGLFYLVILFSLLKFFF